MRADQVTACTLMAAICSILGPLPAEVRAAPPSSRGVGPAVFGEVFRSSRRAMLRVEVGGSAATGFFIGAGGEFVFGAASAPNGSLRVTTIDGQERAAAVIGFEPLLGLAVGRVEGGADHGEPPLRAADRFELALEQWVVILQHDDRGQLEPFAGVVESSAKPTALGPKGERKTFSIAKVAAPGARGSPVLNVSGELVAVVFDPGPRKSRAVSLQSLMPFLRTAILGR